MSITVTNTRADAPRVTLFGMMKDGSYRAEVMNETSVPYAAYWEDSLDQVMVYIDPDAEQLQRLLAALHGGKLRFTDLQNYGSANGGTSDFPI